MAKHYSRRTESAYVDWIRRYIVFHQKRHPSDMGATEIAAFLTWLATNRRVSASTQNQALSALLFLYRDVLRIQLEQIESVPRARMPVRVPVVLSVQPPSTAVRWDARTKALISRRLASRGGDSPSVISRDRSRPMQPFAANHVCVAAVEAVLRSSPTRASGRSTSVGPSRSGREDRDRSAP